MYKMNSNTAAYKATLDNLRKATAKVTRKSGKCPTVKSVRKIDLIEGLKKLDPIDKATIIREAYRASDKKGGHSKE